MTQFCVPYVAWKMWKNKNQQNLKFRVSLQCWFQKVTPFLRDIFFTLFEAINQGQPRILVKKFSQERSWFLKSALQSASKFQVLLIFYFFHISMQHSVHKTVSCPVHRLCIKTQLVTYQLIRRDESSRMVGRNVQSEQRLPWFGHKTTFSIITSLNLNISGTTRGAWLVKLNICGPTFFENMSAVPVSRFTVALR